MHPPLVPSGDGSATKNANPALVTWGVPRRGPESLILSPTFTGEGCGKLKSDLW